MSDNKPFDTIRVGRIKATIWENDNEKDGVFHSVTLARNYRDENGQWQETNTFSVDDMPRIRMATDKAFDVIYARLQQLHYAQRNGSEKENEQKDTSETSAKKNAAKKRSFAKKVEEQGKGPGRKI